MTFSSNDLYMCAYLMAKGVELVDCTSNGKQVSFIFQTDDPKGFEAIKMGWHNSTGQVSGQRLAQQIKALKTMVHEQQR